MLKMENQMLEILVIADIHQPHGLLHYKSVQNKLSALCDSRDKNSSPSTTGKTCKPKIPAHQSEEKLGSEERDEFASIPSGVALATSAAGYF
ncbi:hypothetical protein CDAR_543241 [Caerostris darwini]|uniref:Uncharacterized protein n=1 Tax=Caerostris darwini TaxID=1538125 RepID=A0AAV4WY58_9ARAC|nr:hypothetical protein CDAR_543241 [Caerostris darwini]